MIKETLRTIDEGLTRITNLNISRLLPKTGKVASVPGTVTYVGKEKDETVKMSLMSYTGSEYSEENITSLPQISDFEDGRVYWLNITGVHNEEIIKKCGNALGLHPLVLEDIANTTHRAKAEEYDDYLFIILKMAYFNEDSRVIEVEQVSLVVGKNYVVSFQEREKDVLHGIRERIRHGRGRIRKQGSDYLMYSIADSIVDHYYIVLEQVAVDIEELEGRVLLSAESDQLNLIYALKQELVYLRKSIWPMRDAVSYIQKIEHDVISETAAVFLRDVYDHTVQVLETVEIFGEKASGMLELYMTSVSNRMNEVMKVLTIFAAIFIPLTFFAGVYGMNFEFMPELKQPLAYPIWWAVSLIIAGAMIAFFRRKKWL